VGLKPLGEISGNRRANGCSEACPVNPFRRRSIAPAVIDERPQSIDVDIEDSHGIPIHFDDDPNLRLRTFFSGSVCSFAGLAGLARLCRLDH
jgi:hypothetical protein